MYLSREWDVREEGSGDIVRRVLFLKLNNLLPWCLLTHFVNIFIIYTLLFVSNVWKIQEFFKKQFRVHTYKKEKSLSAEREPRFLPDCLKGLQRVTIPLPNPYRPTAVLYLICTVFRSRKFKISFYFILMSYRSEERR